MTYQPRVAVMAATTASLALGATLIVAPPATAAAGPVTVKGTSGSDFVIMARKGRGVLAVAGTRGGEYMCWSGRVHWDKQWDGWALAMTAPNIYGGKPKYFKDTWYTVGSYRSKRWNLSRFKTRALTANDYRMLKDCRGEIQNAGLLPRGL